MKNLKNMKTNKWFSNFANFYNDRINVFKTLPLYVFMLTIFIVIGIITIMITNIHYLFITMNIAFLCSFLYYNYLEKEEYFKEKKQLVFNVSEIVYVQALIYVFLLVTVFSRLETLLYLLIALLLVLITGGINLYVDFKQGIEKGSRVTSGLFEALSKSVLFTILMMSLSIANAPLNIILSYTIITVCFLLVFYELLFFTRFLIVKVVTVIAIVIIGSFFSNASPYRDYRDEFYLPLITDKYKGEIYVNISNYSEDISVPYPDEIKDYAIQYATTRIIEQDDFIYVYITGDFHNSSIYVEGESPKEYIVEPFTYIGIFNNDFEFVKYYYYDDSSNYVFYEDRFMFVLAKDNYNTSIRRPGLIYEVDGTSIEPSSIAHHDSFTMRFDGTSYYFFNREDKLYRIYGRQSPSYDPIEVNSEKDYQQLSSVRLEEPEFFGDGMLFAKYIEDYGMLIFERQVEARYTPLRSLWHNETVLLDKKLFNLDILLEGGTFDSNDYNIIDEPTNINYNGFKGMFTTKENVFIHSNNQIYRYDFEGNFLDYTEIFTDQIGMEGYSVMAMKDRLVLFAHNNGLIKVIDTDNYADYEVYDYHNEVTIFEYLFVAAFFVLVRRKYIGKEL